MVLFVPVSLCCLRLLWVVYLVGWLSCDLATVCFLYFVLTADKLLSVLYVWLSVLRHLSSHGSLVVLYKCSVICTVCHISVR